MGLQHCRMVPTGQEESPHQKGPDTPYFHATLEDCSRVAAQVQWDTMSTAMRPVLMVRPAQLNCSLEVRVPPNLQSSGRSRVQWQDAELVLNTSGSQHQNASGNFACCCC